MNGEIDTNMIHSERLSQGDMSLKSMYREVEFYFDWKIGLCAIYFFLLCSIFGRRRFRLIEKACEVFSCKARHQWKDVLKSIEKTNDDFYSPLAIHKCKNYVDVSKTVLSILFNIKPYQSGTVFFFDDQSNQFVSHYIRGQIDPMFLTQIHWLIEQMKENLTDIFYVADVRRSPMHVSFDLNGSQRSFVTFCLRKPNRDVFATVFVSFDKENSLSTTDEAEIRSLLLYISFPLYHIHNEIHLRKLLVVDELTNIMNYRGFIKRLEEEIRQAALDRSAVSLLMIDLDFFKNINDTFGHQTGNLVLIHLATILRQLVGEAVFRYGGEEFTVICPKVDSLAVEKIADILRQTVEQNVYYDQSMNIIPITVSIGVSRYPDYAQDENELILQADWALYQAKRKGRNCVVLSH